MKTIINKIFLIALSTLMLSLCIVTITPGPAISAEEIEEDADYVRSSDEVVSGKMTKYSKRAVEVEKINYSLCESVRVFGPKNNMLSLEDIDAAKEVRLFINYRCVRKIKVLRFGE